jgi:small subunit ribosomal protein S2
VIPGNDDAIRSGNLMCRVIADAVEEGRFINARRNGGRSTVPNTADAAFDPEAEALRSQQQAEARRQAAMAQAQREARLAAAKAEGSAEADAGDAPEAPAVIADNA